MPDNSENVVPMTTPTSAAAPLVKELRAHFDANATRSYEWRKQQLEQIIKLIDEQEDALMQALMEDSGKAEFTAYSGDIIFVRAEAKHALKKLKRWMKPRKVGTPLILKPAKSYIRPEPLGVVLVIGAWNFPIHLSLGPLVGAIAAGNTVLIKPSEVSPKVAAFLSQYVPQYLDPKAVKVLEGGIEETQDILAQRFDKILYTGNSHVGKIVMAAAAKHLTPVTLELGGKNPCIVDKAANLKVAAMRIIDTKFLNAGQVCIISDYLLVHEAIYDEFLTVLKATIEEFYGDDPKTSNIYSHIINERHVARLKALLDDAIENGAKLHCGGEIAPDINYIAPTIVTDVDDSMSIMQDEIFGPLLPIVKYSSNVEAIEQIKRHECPLALYVFSEDKATAEYFLNHSNSGSVGINAVMMQVSNPALPFGGVGHSGMDSYHGQFSFDNMSHMRSVMDKSTKVDPRGNYPPFTEKDISLRKKITKWLL